MRQRRRFIGEADFLGVSKPIRIVQEHPEGARMPVFPPIQCITILRHTIKRGLARLVGHCAYPFGVIENSCARSLVHFINGAHQGADEIGRRG
jgi:hypothetical protein